MLGSAAQAQPRLVVVDVSPEALPAPYENLKLGEELRRALEGAGCPVARTCTSEDCARGDGLHVLSFDLRYDRKEFACSFSLEVRDGPGGRVEYREKASSPVCPAAEALDDSRRAARLACGELRKTTMGQTASAAADPGSPPPAGGSSGEPSFLHLPAVPPRALGTAIVATGAAAVVGGAILLYLHGEPTSCALSPDGEQVCTRTRQTALAAVPLLVVGAAAIGWGSWKLIGARDEVSLDRRVTVGIGRGGVVVGGGF